MRSSATKLVTVLGVMTALLAGASSASAAPFVNGIFSLKSELGTNNKLAVDRDGNVWLTLAAGKDVARVTPAGQVDEYELDGVEGAQGIALGPDGNLWVPTTNKVTKFSPADPEGTDQNFTINTINNDGQIVAGPDGFMWVASNESVVRFNPVDPEGDSQSFAVLGLAAKDIDVAGSLIVIADAGGTPRIVTFTIDGTQVDYPLAAKTQGVAGSPSGVIAFSQPDTTEVGLLAPPAPTRLFPQGEDPFGVTFGADGAFWIARAVGGGLTRLSTDGQLTQLGGLPTDFFIRQLTTGLNGTLWVGLEKPGEPGAVARVSGIEKETANPIPPPPPPRPVPQTTIGKGPKKVVKTKKKKAKVKFRFSSSIAGAGFQCWLSRKTGKPQFAIVKFKPCASPKVYRLRPGRYQFSVRAINDGVPDPSPAVHSFRIQRIR
ncbi:MAG: hypothetical protein M3Y75_02145 [Actinomycetota bacterium]|nr:hypothetical protein [Actinomycetota bacterium]